MKKALIVALGALAVLSSVPVFAADVLNCWRTDFHPSMPFMTATIAANGVLSDVRFNYRNSGLSAPAGAIQGELITTNHSPYRGGVRYFVRGAGDLILPANLSNQNLVAIKAKGIGYYKNENGVLISSTEESEGGNHISYRLDCSSTLR